MACLLTLGRSKPQIEGKLHGDLRNEFDFWKVHGIVNTSDLLQS